ncbi:ScbR family autoregulator-binding transcription factor [Streptomyces sp. NPDC059564]|uniref:ScbR family autoregulator-binding transcription factor n=1 Tax=Streptomyces sp. NPDC059564 TaxID=3346865 RepID=UPI00368432E9
MVKQERAARTRESLVRAAAEVFAEEGFAVASVAAISERAGVTPGALHFHFDGKDALARAVEERAVEVVRGITGAGGDPLRALVGSTYALVALLGDDVVVRAGFVLGADLAHRSRVDLRAQWRRWAEESLGSAARAGLLAEGVPAPDAARLVVAATVGLEDLDPLGPGGDAPHALTRIWSVILPGIAAPRTQETDWMV